MRGSNKSYLGYTNEVDPNYIAAINREEQLPPLLSDGWISEGLLKRVHGISLLSGASSGMSVVSTDYYLMLDSKPSKMLLHLDFPEGWRSMSEFLAIHPEYGANVMFMTCKESFYFSIYSLEQAGVIPEEGSVNDGRQRRPASTGLLRFAACPTPFSG